MARAHAATLTAGANGRMKATIQYTMAAQSASPGYFPSHIGSNHGHLREASPAATVATRAIARQTRLRRMVFIVLVECPDLETPRSGDHFSDIGKPPVAIHLHVTHTRSHGRHVPDERFAPPRGRRECGGVAARTGPASQNAVARQSASARRSPAQQRPD